MAAKSYNKYETSVRSKNKFTDTVRLTISADSNADKKNTMGVPKHPGTPSASATSPLSKLNIKGINEKSRDPAYKQLLSSIYDGLIIARPNGDIIDLNNRACHLLQFSWEELTRMNIINLISGAGKEVLGQLAVSVSNGSFMIIEGCCIKKNGEEFPAEIAVHDMRLESRSCLCFFIRDISKRVDLEETVTRMNKAVESTSDAVCITDQNFIPIYLNNAFYNLFGKDFQEQPEDEQFYSIFSDEEQTQGVIQAITSGQNWSEELLLNDISGRVIPIHYRANPITNEEGGLLGAVVIMSDITSIYSAREELKQAIKTIKSSNSELEQFAYVASHDLQEPLRAVKGYLELISQRCEEQLDDKGKKFITNAISGAERMQHLINDLLEYSRIGSEKNKTSECDCQEVIAKVTANLETLIKERNAEIICSELPSLQADSSQILQLFQNLISNAIKFTPIDRSPRIAVKYEEDEDFHYFQVIDNGIGMEEEHAERVFIIFQRLHTQDEYPGSGIGLSICRKIVERLGGEIAITQTSPNEGTVISFNIPKQPFQL